RLVLSKSGAELRRTIPRRQQIGLADAAAGAAEQYAGEQQGCYACHEWLPHNAAARAAGDARKLRAGWGATQRYSEIRRRPARRPVPTRNGARREQLHTENATDHAGAALLFLARADSAGAVPVRGG